MPTTNSFTLLVLSLTCTIFHALPLTRALFEHNDQGKWQLLMGSIGISAMHMQLLHDNKVIIFDRTDFGPSNVSLPSHRCRFFSQDETLKIDCTAHSVLYDVATNSFRPLMVQTDTWCSAGAVQPDGTLVQTGGYNDGDRVVRTFIEQKMAKKKGMSSICQLDVSSPIRTGWHSESPSSFQYVCWILAIYSSIVSNNLLVQWIVGRLVESILALRVVCEKRSKAGGSGGENPDKTMREASGERMERESSHDDFEDIRPKPKRRHLT